MNGKKRFLTVLLTLAVCAGAVAGIGSAVRRTTSGGTVMVVAADTLNYGWYSGASGESVDGYVTTDATQNVYVSDSDSIARVFVKEGDQVRKGDLLLEYDTELAEISLARQELELDQIRLNIEVSEKNLETLKNLRPVSGGGGYVPDLPEEPEVPEIRPYEILNADSVPFNADEEDPDLGKKAYPYRYLVYGDREIIVKREFLQTLISKAKEENRSSWYFQLEAHEGDDPYARIANDGTAYVLADVMMLGKVEGDMVLDFTEDEPALREKIRTYTVLFVDDSGELIGTVSVKENEPVPEPDRPEREGYAFKGWFLQDAVYDFSLPVKSDLALSAKWEEEGPPEPTETPDPTVTPEPEPTDAPDPTTTPEPEPTETPDPTVTPKPEPTEEPCPTETPEPEPTEAPEPTGMPEQEPAGTPESAGTSDPEPDEKPDPSGTAEAEWTPEPEGSAEQPPAEGSLTAMTGRPSAMLASLKIVHGKPYPGPIPVNVMIPALDDDSGSGFSISGGPRLIPSDAEYSKEELVRAIREEEENLQSLKLDEREADLKYRLKEKAVREGAVSAKMDGVVKKAADPAKPPTDGSPFVQITSSKGLFVQGNMSETMLDRVKEGDTVTVQSWQTGMMYEAEITEISPYPSRDVYYGYYGMNSSASSYPFLACISDTDAVLGQSDSLQITFGDAQAAEELMPDEDALYLYKAFILEENGKKYVYKRGSDGLLVRQEIETGELSGQGWQIISGVTMQDYLAFPYGKDVKEGAKTREGTLEELYLTA